jgi:hypothetical protein
MLYIFVSYLLSPDSEMATIIEQVLESYFYNKICMFPVTFLENCSLYILNVQTEKINCFYKEIEFHNRVRLVSCANMLSCPTTGCYILF